MAKTQKIPKTSKEARKRDYAGTTVTHSEREKRKWVLLKHKGKWAFASATSAMPTGSHTVCYFDPDTGFYDDCHQS